jgi:hypothetical protein
MPIIDPRLSGALAELSARAVRFQSLAKNDDTFHSLHHDGMATAYRFAVVVIQEAMARPDPLQAAVDRFLREAGHGLCHENRKELAEAFGIELPSIEAWPCLPPSPEFKRRCDEYHDELYGPDGPSNLGPSPTDDPFASGK